MKVLDARAHGILDYLTVAIFALAPTVLSMTGTPAMIAYALAAIHFLLTLITAFPLGLARLVPFPAHGVIELLVSIALIALPWIAGFIGNARIFYSAIGVVILVVWLMTNYRSVSSAG
ncbi:MAG: hypothetical protein ACRD3J_12325 [Thermoanaerobaculia bacterium]